MDKQLATEQWENGSWGRFHTQDTKSQLKQKFIEYIWHRKDGIYYCTNCPSSDIGFLESKNFLTWLSGLENLCDFSLFPEFMSMGTSNHLLNEIHRLMYNDVYLPKSSPIFGLLRCI